MINFFLICGFQSALRYAECLHNVMQGVCIALCRAPAPRYTTVKILWNIHDRGSFSSMLPANWVITST
jgi:hypothetical protein